MRDVVITAAAAVTGLGDSLETTWRRLLNGESAFAPVTRFAVEAYTSRTAACVPDLAPGKDGSRLTPLLERLLDNFPAIPETSPLMVATTKGAIDVVEQRGDSPPAAMEAALPSALVEGLRRRLGLRGPGVAISAACASSGVAVGQAASMVASGRADSVLVVCCDLVSEFVFSGFSALKALDPEGCRPFDRKRAGLTLGEGAAALLLMSRSRARDEGRLMLARILGWGAANDAHHITAPARDGLGLRLSVGQALERAGLKPEAVDAVNAHGTGTVYNDLMELVAFGQLFPGRPVPIHSVKGALGHTLGAAGGIEIGIGIRSLATGMLPPTVGFETPEEGAEGRVSASPLPFPGEVLLCTNSGFGGINASVLLGKGEAA